MSASMSNGEDKPTERDSRAERLGEALRANLHRRKAQSRARASTPDTGDDGAEEAGES